MGGWRGEIGLGMSGNGGMGWWVVIYIHGDVFECVLTPWVGWHRTLAVEVGWPEGLATGGCGNYG